MRWPTPSEGSLGACRLPGLDLRKSSDSIDRSLDLGSQNSVDLLLVVEVLEREDEPGDIS